uniref:Uncharacterized protein n=1 Tax=Trichogramma kaykai TaxID=54128 RepID=A0ABD2WIV7_9HYME
MYIHIHNTHIYVAAFSAHFPAVFVHFTTTIKLVKPAGLPVASVERDYVNYLYLNDDKRRTATSRRQQRLRTENYMFPKLSADYPCQSGYN